MEKTKTEFEEQVVAVMAEFVKKGIVKDFLVIYTNTGTGGGSISNITDKQEVVHLATAYAAAMVTGQKHAVRRFMVDLGGEEQAN